MRTKEYRDDLLLAAYATTLGYAIEASKIDDTGIPHDALKFNLGAVSVWATSRGWRVAKLANDGMWPKPQNSDFHSTVKAALDAGAKLNAN